MKDFISAADRCRMIDGRKRFRHRLVRALREYFHVPGPRGWGRQFTAGLLVLTVVAFVFTLYHS